MKSSSVTSKKVARYFDDHADDFDKIYLTQKGIIRTLRDRLSRGTVVRRLRFVNELDELHNFKRVIDVGCGSGRFGIDLAKRGAEVVGLDFAPNMIALARDLATRAGVAERCTFLVEDFATWEPDGSFDLGLAVGVVDYVPDPNPLLERLSAITNGAVVVSFPRRLHPLVPLRYARLKRAGCPVFFYSLKDVRRYGERHVGSGGFRIVRLGRDHILVGKGL